MALKGKKEDLKLQVLELKLSVHELEARLNMLERKRDNQRLYEEFDSRLQILEAFYDNITSLSTKREEN